MVDFDETYWNNVLVEASVAAMQGIQESGKFGIAMDVLSDKLAEASVRIGKCLVSELKKEINNSQK